MAMCKFFCAVDDEANKFKKGCCGACIYYEFLRREKEKCTLEDKMKAWARTTKWEGIDP